MRAAALLVFFCLLATSAQAETCIASVYSTKEQGTRTASGIPLNDRAPTMAHKTRALGSYAMVTHGQRTLTMRVTDRGPFRKRRCVDLSVAAAKLLKCNGLCKVSVE